MKQVLISLALGLAAFQEGAAQDAVPAPPRSLEDTEVSGDSGIAQHPRFTALDSDGDGYVSRAEAKADPELGLEFINFDETQDDRLNEKEFAKFLAPKELKIPLPIDIGGRQSAIEIKPASPPLNTGPDIAP